LKRYVWFVIAVAFIADGLALAGAIMLQSTWAVVVVLASFAVGFYWIFIRFRKRMRPRYPLVPPEGKPDIYSPRTNIPRPIYDDFRRMEEKRRQFEKLRKLSRKKKQAT